MGDNSEPQPAWRTTRMSGKSKKKPLVHTVSVVIDDDAAVALQDARAALEAAEEQADARYEQRLSLVRANTASADELLRIERQLADERDATLQPLRDAVEQAEEAVRAGSEYYVFRSAGYRAYEDLVAAHPPEDEDHDRARKATGRAEAQALWADATFEPALISLTCVANAVSEENAKAIAKNPPGRDHEPVMTVEEASELRDEWTDSEWDVLWTAAITVSRGRRQVDVGKASRAARKPA